MDSLGITSFDLLVLAVLLLSALYGIARGFTHEVLSLLAWVGAALAVFYGFPHLQPLMRDYLEPESFADIASVVVLAVASLILFKLLAGLIGGFVKESALGPLDRSFGALFGFVRGLFVICLVFLVASWAIPQKNMPAWVKEARSRPLVEYGASLIASVSPAEFFGGESSPAKPDLDRTMIDAVKERIPASSFGSEREKREGYGSEEREALEQLLERNI